MRPATLDLRPTTFPRTLFLDHAAVLGGAELSLLDIAREAGPESVVALYADGPFRDRLSEAGVAVEVLNAPQALLDVTRDGGLAGALGVVPAIGAQARRVAKRLRDFDVALANSQKAFVTAALAAPLARRPVVWHLRDVMTADHFSRANRTVAITLANRFAAAVICNSQATADAFVEAGGKPGLVRVVLNGIDAAPFDAVTVAQVAKAKAELGLDERPIVGVFSRLAPWKGQHVLLDALAGTNGSLGLPGVQALVVGDAIFPEDRAYAETLRARAAASSLAGRVTFAGFRDDVPVLLHCCDIVAHTSVAAEPFGRVIVEGMLAERAVVATAAGGAVEILTDAPDDSATGRLVPPGDAAALRTALAALLADPSRTRTMAAAARTDAETRFGTGRVAREVAEVLQEAVA
ncbi:MAG: glycosyltransferase family 4 protein [Bacteroidota bacterium]